MVDRIDSKMTTLPPLWMSRIVASSPNISNHEEIRKLLGEPIPRAADISKLKPEIAAMFMSGGVLERIRSKLGTLTRKKGKKLVPAHNTVACVDDEDTLYVGVEFLEQFGHDESLLAGILAHEWGHMMSDLPRDVDWNRLTWDQLFEIRREEESFADGFAGRAVFLMGYAVEPMMEFLEKLEKKRNPKLPTLKYHNLATRKAILKESYAAASRATEMARKLFFRTWQFINQG